MSSDKEIWDNIKKKYLREVEKALSSVGHPRSKEILEDVGAHLDRRAAELGPEEQTWEDFQAIITDMGPACDYAELLRTGAERAEGGSLRRYRWLIGAAAGVAVLGGLLLAAVLRPGKRFPETLNESQRTYMEFVESRVASLKPKEYVSAAGSVRAELEQKWLKALDGQRGDEYYDAINGLAAMKSEKARGPLLRIATERREKDNRDRWMATRALGIVGDESTVPELIPLIYHYNQDTRFWAQISLVRLTKVNFGADWQAWGRWWNERKGVPAFDGLRVVWTRRPDLAAYADEQKQREIDRRTVEQLKGKSTAKRDTSVETYIVTFEPVAPFSPKRAGELLDAFNANCPRGVRTHHFRTEARDNILIGHICVDTKAGKDAIVKMLEKSEKLRSVAAEAATDQGLEKLYRSGQPSLPGGSGGVSSGQSRGSSRTRPPESRNETVNRSGTWPDGDCGISGDVYRRASYGRVRHGKVCLSCEEFGTWAVEVDEHGRFDFANMPSGRYMLWTVDTAGYNDACYNPENSPTAKPTFQLESGQRLRARLEVTPTRPYRAITGRVLDETGEPPADYQGLRVYAWVEKNQGQWKGHYGKMSSSAVSEDGCYTLDELDGRPVYVQVLDWDAPKKDNPYPPRFYPGAFSRNQAKLVEPGDRSVVDGVDIAMQRTGGLALEGRVTVHETGEAVGEALVSIFHFDMFFDLFCSYTDGQGQYRIEGLGEGTYMVHVDAVHKGFVKTRHMVNMSEQNKGAQMDFGLSRGVLISGTIVDEAGNRLELDRPFGHVEVEGRGFGGRASNFPYGNRYAPEHIRKGTTVIYEEGEGDATSAMMIFPTPSSFLVPAVMPGKPAFDFRPRGQRILRILYQGRDILKTGLAAEAGQKIKGVTIVASTR